MRLAAALRLAAAGVTLAAALAACDKDKDVEPPKALVAIDAKLAIERVWSTSLGGKDRALRLALAPALDGARLYAAGSDGDVQAFEPASGRSLWRTRTKLALSAGPAAAAGLVVVGASDGAVVALDAATGAIRWQTRLSGEVLSAPAVTSQAVVVRSVDGRVRGLAPDNGHELWSNEQSVPRLTLRGAARPLIVGDTVICGFDNGRVAAYGLASGDTIWETAVSPPHGRTELERLVDIDGALQVSGRDVFVAGFQGRVAMLALDSGQIWWAREASSYRGLALDGETLYVVLADGIVQALRRRDGTPLWQQDRLARRGLTAPVIDGDAVVVADFQGYVHWLDRASGALVGRIDTSKGRVTNAPLAGNGFVYLQTDAGGLYALRARAR